MRQASPWQALVRAVLFGALLLGPRISLAHGLDPVGITVSERADGHVSVRYQVPAQVPEGRVRVALPAGCEPWLDEPSSYHCDRPLSGRSLAVAGLEGRDGAPSLEALVKVELADGRAHRAAVDAGAPQVSVPNVPDRFATVATYSRLGAHHFVTGWDHLLFALGVLALARNPRSAALLLTSFAVGHSLTLSAAVLGYLSFPRALAELLIALTLIGLALRVGQPQADAPEHRRERPWGAAAATLGVGLVHGLGFASALRDAGLPEGEVPAALLAFNLGVEVAQLGALLLAALVGHALGHWRPGVRAPSRLALAHALGALSVMWCCERALILVGLT